MANEMIKVIAWDRIGVGRQGDKIILVAYVGMHKDWGLEIGVIEANIIVDSMMFLIKAIEQEGTPAAKETGHE